MGLKCAVCSATIRAAILESLPTFAQVSAADANKRHNALHRAASFILRNVHTPTSLFGARAHTNDLPLRSTVPIGPNSGIVAPENLRGPLPISAGFDSSGGYNAGPGDTNPFDAFRLSHDDLPFGVGAAGAYDLVMRIDGPDRTVLDGSWTFPELRKH